MSLSPMQKKYIWLAGSFPARVVEQGRGKRTRKLLYALDGDDTLVIFGYSSPLKWLVLRDLFRELQEPGKYVLTGAGEQVFEQLRNPGMISTDFQEVQVKPRPDNWGFHLA